METVITRMMRESEAERVADLLVRANEENLAAFPREVALAYVAEIVDVARRHAFADIYVAEVAGRLVGSVTYLPDATHDAHPWPPGGAVLRLLAVDAVARGRGLGERLTKICIERASKQGALFLGLHTAAVMAAARRIYERLGFVRVPAHDFNPLVHYVGAAGGGSSWGLAYVLRFGDLGRGL